MANFNFYFFLLILFFEPVAYSQSYNNILSCEYKTIYSSGPMLTAAKTDGTTEHYFFEFDFLKELHNKNNIESIAESTSHFLVALEGKEFILFDKKGKEQFVLEKGIKPKLIGENLILKKLFVNEEEWQNFLEIGKNDLPIPPPATRSVVKYSILDINRKEKIPFVIDQYKIAPNKETHILIKKGGYWFLLDLEKYTEYKIEIEDPERVEFNEYLISLRKNNTLYVYNHQLNLIFTEPIPSKRSYTLNGQFVNIKDPPRSNKYIRNPDTRILNIKGEYITPREVIDVAKSQNDYCIVTSFRPASNGVGIIRFKGVIDSKGDTLIPFEYKEIAYLDDSSFYCEKATYNDRDVVLQTDYFLYNSNLQKQKIEKDVFLFKQFGNVFLGKNKLKSMTIFNNELEMILPKDYSYLKHVRENYFIVSTSTDEGVRKGLFKFN